MKRILITGGAGFFGHHLIEHILKNTDYSITVLDSLSYASRGFDRLRDIGAYDDKRVARFTHDIAVPMPCGLRQELGSFHYIAHCAAETHVDNSIRDPLRFVSTNVTGTAMLLEYARTLNSLERFLYFSTDEVFGPAAIDQKQVDYTRNPTLAFQYDEWDRYNSTNPYSATKAAGEELCLAWANTYRLPIIISHCMNLFGERQHPEKFIPGTIRKVLQGELVTIHASPAGRPGARTYLHCRNAADAAIFLLGKGTNRDKYNIVGQEEVDNYGLAQWIATHLNRDLNYELVDFHSSRPGHDLRYGLSNQKLAHLGWNPPVDFGTSLIRTIDWFVEHPEWLNYESR